MQNKKSNTFGYKLIICILFIINAWLIYFNMAISTIYEEEIMHYQNEVEYDHKHRREMLDILLKLIDKKTINKNEVDYYENRYR